MNYASMTARRLKHIFLPTCPNACALLDGLGIYDQRNLPSIGHARAIVLYCPHHYSLRSCSALVCCVSILCVAIVPDCWSDVMYSS